MSENDGWMNECSGAIQARGSLEFEETGEAQTVPINNNNSLIPAWMLQHLTN